MNLHLAMDSLVSSWIEGGVKFDLISVSGRLTTAQGRMKVLDFVIIKAQADEERV
jgi:hypothetical protein